MDTENICGICTSEFRDKSVIAIVEKRLPNYGQMERSSHFKGLYHVLGYNLSATSRQNPSILRLPELLNRCFKKILRR